MYVNAQNIRYLFAEDAALAAAQLLSLTLPGMGAGDEERVKNGKRLLRETGYLQSGENEPDVMPFELAFLLTGLCKADDALEWRRGDTLCQTACYFEGVYLLFTHLKTGKWALAPYRASQELLRAIRENRGCLPRGCRVTRRGADQEISGAQLAEYWKEHT